MKVSMANQMPTKEMLEWYNLKIGESSNIKEKVEIPKKKKNKEE